MKSFRTVLTPGVWFEVLHGQAGVAFDVDRAGQIEIGFTEGKTAPDGGTAHKLSSFRSDRWDFEYMAVETPEQRVWVRGAGTIKGVRMGWSSSQREHQLLDVLCRIEDKIDLQNELIQGLG